MSSEQDIEALAGCRRIDGDLWITESRLESLAGLEQIEEARFLVIGQNHALSSLEGLGLRSVAGVTLWSNPRLTELDPLTRLETLPALALVDEHAVDPVATLPATSELSLATFDAEQ